MATVGPRGVHTVPAPLTRLPVPLRPLTPVTVPSPPHSPGDPFTGPALHPRTRLLLLDPVGSSYESDPFPVSPRWTQKSGDSEGTKAGGEERQQRRGFSPVRRTPRRPVAAPGWGWGEMPAGGPETQLPQAPRGPGRPASAPAPGRRAEPAGRAGGQSRRGLQQEAARAAEGPARAITATAPLPQVVSWMNKPSPL